jgi:pyruvate,water dikinase
MISPRCITLGSGDALRVGVGNKAGLLDRAAQAGLPVPVGYILTDSAYAGALASGLLVIQGEQVSAPDAAALWDALKLPPMSGPVAVRSAFSAEDRADQSLAGFFTSRLHVEAADPRAMIDALCAVWGSALKRAGDFRRDVLILRMVAAQQAGVAFTEREFEDDLINVTAGTAEKLVAGEEAGESRLLPKLRRFERPTGAGGWPARLQNLLRGVRAAFGQQDWDIEWADDGTRCWLVQIRPVTRRTLRNEVFTAGNLKEIFPDLPSRFMVSVIESVSADLFAYSAFDPAIPRARPFIESFNGRIYINLTILADTMRVLGLPTRLVTDNIGGEAGQAAGLNPLRMAHRIATLTLPRFALAQLLSTFSAERAGQAMIRRAGEPLSSLTAAADLLAWTYTCVVREAMILATAIGPTLSLLRLAGTLEEHNARNSSIGAQMVTDLEPLRALLASEPGLGAEVAAGRAPADPRFQALWSAYLGKHGHRGIYESDVARPRYHEAPAPLLALLAAPPLTRLERPRRTLRGWLTWPIWWQAGRTVRARELLRYRSMIGWDAARRGLLQHAQPFVQSGALRSSADLWLLDLAEVRQLEAGWVPDAGFWSAREAEIKRLEAYAMPDLLCRFDDLETYRAGAAPSGQSRLKGISLTGGERRGRAWLLHEPALALPEGFQAAETILVARSIDAGWIPTFSLVAGVAVETGGDLSHGSIILREIGIPAITNVAGLTRALRTGDVVILRAGQGALEVLPDGVSATA